ncbi:MULTISPECIES: 2,3-butanediol dehydrogenase [Terribacillus]|uniref:Butanediol dehydrogenase n=1 Tax=Terribacillus saccharophilus TaxID=361277 RepID=A0ABX4H1J0_9BACI|nr:MULTISPECIES: 2,3-butanediol dehydrogenase [Terribacillus]PAD36647.1 butanediol dehydrogenase [Terribacillus saccharophilus]PAD97629.1 butanediol dehydrogenase [Terribacillus saccharophilus]PAE01011.1 butanediol dehydrogenase [Terribacillus saccharophilus]
MKSLVYYGSKNVKVENITEPEVSKDTVKIKVKFAGICGTDLHEYLHKTFVTEDKMILGHEFTGEIVEVGDNVTRFKTGDRVAVEPIWGCGECDTCKTGNYNICPDMKSYGIHENGGFAEYVVVKEANVFALPDTLSYEFAALIEPLAVVLQAIRKSKFKIGDSVALFGAGPIGLLLSESLRAAGASKIFVAEVSEERRKLALEMGADIVINPIEEDAVQVIKNNTNGGVDVSFDVAGVEATFNQSLDCIKPNGEFMIVSVFANPVNYHPTMQVVSEKKINSSLGYNNIFAQSIDLLAKGSLNVEPVITSVIALDNIVEDGFEKLISDKNECKILVKPS